MKGLTKGDYDAMLGRVKANKTGVNTWVGIDPGTHTGWAIWDSATQRFLEVTSMNACEAEHRILIMRDSYRDIGRTLHVVFEDARSVRLPKSMQNSGRLKGAGSVGRDASRWAQFLEYHGIPHSTMQLSPKPFRSSTQEWFTKTTGWDKRTNEHARSAAGLVHLR